MTPSNEKPDALDDAVAIIGMACRFPGEGSTPEGFWNMITAARTAHSPIPKSRFNADAWYHPDPDRKGAIGVKSGFFLDEDPGLFDAPFFSMPASEAHTMDPMHRLLLEVAYEGLENAGIPMSSVAGSDTGCFVGCFTKDYDWMSVADIHNTGPYVATGTGPTMLSNRISWFFDLHGPSMTIDTACSSSMYALHLACQSIKAGDIKQAIIGGTNLLLCAEMFHTLSKMHMLGPDGKCHSFDDRANGYARGEAIGSLIIKSLKDAITDGDTIRAVIRNTGCNQDGRTPGITMPSAQAQADLIEKTYAKAGLSLTETAYFEAHGTGTPLGDPLELSALGSTFGAARSAEQPPLYVSSVKTNIGHTEGCSALAGIIKAVMSIENGVIAPNAEFENLNPKLRLDAWKLALPPKAIPWPTFGVRRVSVNSFGYGGANGHVILDDAASFFKSHGLNGKHMTRSLLEVCKSNDDSGFNSGNDSEIEDATTTRTPKLFILSTFDQAGMQRLGSTLGQYIFRLLTRSETKKEAMPSRIDIENGEYLNQLAYTLSSRRSIFDNRSFAVASTLDELKDRLYDNLPKVRRANKNNNLFMIFTGQGAHWQRMGAELLAYPVFSKSLDFSQEYLRSLGCPWNLIEELLRKEDSRIHEPSLSQPICTALQIALVDLLSDWGVRAKTVVGHSSGEIGAAYAAQIISHETAIRVAYFRGVWSSLVDERLGSDVAGAMMAAGVGETEVEPYLARISSGKAVVACINSPLSVTLSGDSSAISELQAMLTADGKFARALRVSTAYHSHHMMTIASDYLASMGDLPRLVPPEGAPVMFSSVTGGRIEAAEIDATYWVKNMTSPVRFSQAVSSLLSHCETGKRRKTFIKYSAMIEVGPHAALQGPLKQILTGVDDRLNNTILYNSVLLRGKPADVSALDCIGSMWTQGLSMDLTRVNLLDQSECKALSDLPAYPWNHTKSFWHESALSRSNRSRELPRDDLLGMPAPCQNTLRPRWRQFLSIREQPWLEHHNITSTILYPGAGMLIMAIEAARQTADPNRTVKGFEFRDVSFDRGLVIPSDPELAVETSLDLQPHKLDNKVIRGWYRFTLSSLSLDSTDNWIEHCTGLISTVYDDVDDIDAGADSEEEWAHHREIFGLMTTTCQRPVEKSAFYKNLTDVGMGYGQLFQNLTDAYGGPGCGFGTVTIPDTKASMPFGYEYPHLIHPATLDAIFHLFFVGLESGGELTESAVPVSMGSMFIAAELPHGVGSIFQGYTVGKKTTAREGSGSIVVSDEGWSSAKILINDFVACKVSGMDQEPELELEQLCTKIDWIQDVDLAGETDTNDTMQTIEQCLLAWMERLCYKHSDLNVLVMQSSDDPLFAEILQRFAPRVGERARFDLCTVVGTDERIISQTRKQSDEQSWICDWKIASFEDFVSQQTSEQNLFDLIIAPHLDQHDSVAILPLLRPRGWALLNDLVELPSETMVTRHKLDHVARENVGLIIATHKTIIEGTLPRNVALLVPEVLSSALEALRSHLVLALSAKNIAVSNYTLKDIEQLHGEHIVSLLEVEQGFTIDFDESRFEKFRKLCISNPYMLWVSGSSLACSPSTGLLRVVRTELPQIRLPHFIMSSQLVLEPDHCSDCIMDIFMTTLKDGAELIDMEYREDSGKLLIPRITSYSSFDKEIDMSRPSPKPLKSSLKLENRPLKLTTKTLGSLDSLQWVHDDAYDQDLDDDGVEIRVVSVPIHRTDARNAVGDSLSDSLGHEAEGIITRLGKNVTDLSPGQRVITIYKGSCRTMLKQHRSVVAVVPSHCGSNLPAIIPLIHALHAVDLAGIMATDNVLVHMAATAIGQLAIQLIQEKGATVFVTLESADQRTIICERYGIKPAHVLSLTDMKFVNGLKRLTLGRGVNVVLNTLCDETFPHTWSCVAEGGRFIDLTENASKVVIDTAKQISYHRINTSQMLAHTSPEAPKLLSDAYKIVDSGILSRNSEATHLKISDAKRAFDMSRYDNVEGNIVLDFDEDSCIPVAPTRPAGLELDPLATYMVSGGLGGLGPGVVSMMIQSGAKHIVTLSRSGARTQRQKDYVQQWRDAGCVVDALCCDCGDARQLNEVMIHAQKSNWIVKGVVQLAMVLMDAPFELMTFEQWQGSIGPKIEGTWNLHEYLPKDLDFFIALSSISNVIGNSGQANYCAGNAYQEALCQHRTALGLKGTSINLGLMSDTEVFDTSDAFGEFLQKNSKFIQLQFREADFLVALKACMNGRTSDGLSVQTQVITSLRNNVIRDSNDENAIWTNDRKLDLRLIPSCERPAKSTTRSRGNLSTAALLESCKSFQDVSAVFEAALRGHIARAMTADTEDIDPDKPLHAYGVDSLKAVEVRNWILKETKSEISVFDILSQMSIAKLSEKIATNSKLVGREVLENI